MVKRKRHDVALVERELGVSVLHLHVHTKGLDGLRDVLE